jgi:hypothetical protein
MIMNHFTISLGLLAGLLQFLVAAFALRLICLFGLARVGRSLCGVFVLMALLQPVQAFAPFNLFGLMIYAVISLLLFASLVHLLLKERVCKEIDERRRCAELEADVEKKSAYLLKAIEQLHAEMDERKLMVAETGCLNPAKPGLFDSFSNMIQAIPATAIVKTLIQESYLLEVNLACHRQLSASEAGSILIFSHFVGVCGRGAHLPPPVTLPPAQVAFYRRTVERLILAGELPPAARPEFEKSFIVPAQESDARKVLRPRSSQPAMAGKRDWFGLNAGQIQPGRSVAA